MSALIKYSILPLLAIASAIYLYNLSGGGDFDDVRLGPLDQICKRDGERLAQLRAKPSFGEALRFEGELSCLELWPQLAAILNSLSNTAASTESPGSTGAIPNELSAGESAPPASLSPAMEATSPTWDDACKREEERLAELQAKPSLDEAVRFEDELKCSKLQPQLLALLDGLSQAPQSTGAPSPNGAAPDPMSAGGAEPPASPSPAMEPTSRTLDDACKRDEDRLDRLRHSPSSEGAARFAEELSCEKLRPQVMALTGDLARPPPPGSAGVSKAAAAETNMTNEAPPASEASATSQAAADAGRRIVALERERDALA